MIKYKQEGLEVQRTKNDSANTEVIPSDLSKC